MGITASLVLIAVGAILRFAVDVSAHIGSTTVNWNIVGDVLMAVGAIGLVITLVWLASARRNGSTVMVDRGDVPDHEYR